MAQLTTAGIHHITLVSGDAERTIRFYRDLLGQRLVKRTVNYDEPTSYHLYLGDELGRPGTVVTFFEMRGEGRGRPGIGGVHHLAFGVATEDGLLMWKRWLSDRGVRVSGPYDRGYFTSIYFPDPDGQILEIATAGPGYTIDEPAAALGRELLLPPERIVRGHRDEAAIAALTHPEPVESITAEMSLAGLHHISGITNDLAAAGDFYEGVLGLSLVKKTVNRDDPTQLHYFWASQTDGVIAPHSAWTLFGWPESWNPARGGVGQTHHVAFRAADDAQLEQWLDHLREMGVKSSDVLDRTYFRSLYFRAPDGLLLELATDGPGFDVDERRDGLGSELMLPASLEPRREEIRAALSR